MCVFFLETAILHTFLLTEYKYFDSIARRLLYDVPGSTRVNNAVFSVSDQDSNLLHIVSFVPEKGQ